MHLILSDLHKSYGGAPALAGASLALRGGETHALMGENGAGKSTLIKVLAGLERPDRLALALDGRPLRLDSPADALRAGFRFVHQEVAVVPALTVAETVLLGRPLPRRLGLVHWRAAYEEAAGALARLGLSLDPRQPTGRLSPGDRMLARLASVAAGGAPRLLVLDEPTAALGARDSDRLFAAVAALEAEGTAVLLVSHRLPEVVARAARVTVLRDGRTVLAAPLAGTPREAVIAAMTGRAQAAPAPRAPAAPGPVLLRLQGRSGRLRLDLEARGGEVVGLAGLEGAGQSDLLRLLMGDGPRFHGQAELLGKALPRSPGEAWARGIAFVPRDRRHEGLLPSAGAAANVALPHLSALSLLGLSRPRAERALAREATAPLALKARSLSQPVRHLSGGNAQKVVLARALARSPKVLLLDEPTRGVDVGARADIHGAVRALAARGALVLLASTDLPELLLLSDRLLLLDGGEQAALAGAAGLDAAALLALIQPRAAA